MFKWLMLAVYILLAAYLLWRGFHCLRGIHPGLQQNCVRIPVAIVFILLWSTLLLGGLLPDSAIQLWLHKFSNFWLGFFIYLIFFTVVLDIAVLLIKLCTRKKHPKFFSLRPVYLTVMILVILVSAGTTLYGFLHAQHIVTNAYEVTVDKDCGDRSDLNIVLISDLHLGYSIGCDMMEQMVEKVNALEPDIILIAGDIVDNDYDALDDPEQLAEILHTMKSTYGTYGVYGNHDVDALLIGGFSVTSSSKQLRDPKVVQFLDDCGITMLKDESVLIDDSFYVIGRLDGEHAGDGTDNRESIETLTSGLDLSKPCFILCHEPDELQENVAAGMDLQLSGHTHAGQFFPLTITAPLTWENYWGYKRIDQMHSFVSSGIGVYGPDIRVATDSEIMQITVHFNG